MHLCVVGRKWCCREGEGFLLHRVLGVCDGCCVSPQLMHWRVGVAVFSGGFGFCLSDFVWLMSVWIVGCWKLCFCCNCLWHLSDVLELRTGSRQCVQLYVTGRKMCW